MIGAYIVGVPGSGKSSLMRAAARGLEATLRARPVPHVAYWCRDSIAAVELGVPHPRFPGTDRLSMSIQPEAAAWVCGAPAPVIVGEGDRLATDGFLGALEASCEDWWLVLLDTPADVAAERRAGRGSSQSPAWLRGRSTKIARLTERWASRLFTVDGGASPEAQLARLRECPAFAWIGCGS